MFLAWERIQALSNNRQEETNQELQETDSFIDILLYAIRTRRKWLLLESQSENSVMGGEGGGYQSDSKVKGQMCSIDPANQLLDVLSLCELSTEHAVLAS